MTGGTTQADRMLAPWPMPWYITRLLALPALITVAVVGSQQGKEGMERFGKRFGLFVTVHDNHQRAAGMVPEQHGIERLGRGGEAGERDAAAGGYAAHGILKGRMPG